MTPTGILKHEHKVILLVLSAAEREAKHIRATGEVRADTVGKMLDFFTSFADRCHHSKEEDLLFVRMQARGAPRESGPIALMLTEHDLGRTLLAALRRDLPRAGQGDAALAADIASYLSAYVELLRAHIAKEDNVLYPLADRILTEEDQAQLTDDFERVEAEEMGEGVHDKYHQLAHELAEG